METDSILIVESNPTDAHRTRTLIEKSQLRPANITWLSSLAGARALGDRLERCVVLLELVDTIDPLITLRKVARRATAIALVKRKREILAQRSLQNGAEDYLLKEDLGSALLEKTIVHALERRLLADQLRNSQEALSKAKQDANAAIIAKNEFLSVMSHEFRTPMNGITCGINLLASNSLNDSQKEVLKLMMDCARNQLGMIEDILEIARLDGDVPAVSDTEFSLRECMVSVHSHFSLIAREKGLQFTCKVPQDAPRTIRGDRNRLRQILINLTSNAIKFTDSGTVSMEAKPRDKRLLFEISDTGIGIPAEHLPTIFTPFSQVDKSTTRHHHGAGLGLSVSKSLATAIGGEICAHSQLGKGSSFVLSLPLSEPPKNEAKQTDRSLLGI